MTVQQLVGASALVAAMRGDERASPGRRMRPGETPWPGMPRFDPVRSDRVGPVDDQPARPAPMSVLRGVLPSSGYSPA